jgi:hypothetical protein
MKILIKFKLRKKEKVNIMKLQIKYDNADNYIFVKLFFKTVCKRAFWFSLGRCVLFIRLG